MATGGGKWRVNRAGPQWLMDAEQRVVGYKDIRGRIYYLPQELSTDEAALEAKVDPSAAGEVAVVDVVTLRADQFTASRSTNNAMLAATQAAMSAGQKLVLPMGRLPADLIYTKGITVHGAGQPIKVGNTLVGGTVLLGSVVMQDIAGAKLFDIGIEQSGLDASFIDALNTGFTTERDADHLDQEIRRVTCLGRGYAGAGNGSIHGINVQSGTGVEVSGCMVYRYLNNYVSRANSVSFSYSYSEDAEGNALLIKSSNTDGVPNNANDNTVFRMVARATGAGKSADFFVLGQDSGSTYKSRRSKIAMCSAIATDGATARFYAAGKVIDAEFAHNTSVGDASGSTFLAEVGADHVTFMGNHAESPTGFAYVRASGAGRSFAIGCTVNNPGASPGTQGVTGDWTYAQVNGVVSVARANVVVGVTSVDGGDFVGDAVGGARLSSHNLYDGAMTLLKTVGAANNTYAARMRTNNGANGVLEVATVNAAMNAHTFDSQVFAFDSHATRNSRMGFGGATIGAYMTLPAGRADAGYAPLKMTSGTNLTTPENGTFEFNGTNLFFTAGGTRRTISWT